MKKINLGIAVSLMGIAMIMGSCKNELANISENSSNNQAKSEIAKTVASLNKEGYFDLFLTKSRAIDIGNEDLNYIKRFINDTDSVLEEIEFEENGKEQIAVINALFCNGTVEDFAESFAKLDSEKAEDFVSYANKNLNLIGTNSARSISSTAKLSYANSLNLSTRAAFSSDLEWSTIAWYTGFCASTVAGFYLASYGGLWTRIAGIAAMSAGAISMSTQLTIWCSSSSLSSFVQGMFDKEALTLNADKDSTIKLFTILTETVVTLVACAVSPIGKVVLNYIIDVFNDFIGSLLTNLPRGITYKVLDFPLKEINNYNTLKELFTL